MKKIATKLFASLMLVFSALGIVVSGLVAGGLVGSEKASASCQGLQCGTQADCGPQCFCNTPSRMCYFKTS